MRPLAPLLDLLAPPRCLACRARGEPPWCHDCRRRVDELRLTGTCVRCAGPPGRDHACWAPAAVVTRTVACFRYAGPVADAIVAAKVHGAHAAWPALGRELAAVTVGLAPDVVTWVPTRARTRRARGLDHARLLAQAVAASVGRPLVGLLEAAPGRDQASRDLAARRTLAPDAFAARRTAPGASVLLVDDVLTTGATAHVAATALGAADVCVAVLARAGNHPLGPLRPR